jgi:hypothetical protein
VRQLRDSVHRHAGATPVLVARLSYGTQQADVDGRDQPGTTLEEWLRKEDPGTGMPPEK